jgi:hypothetical protein
MSNHKVIFVILGPYAVNHVWSHTPCHRKDIKDEASHLSSSSNKLALFGQPALAYFHRLHLLASLLYNVCQPHFWTKLAHYFAFNYKGQNGYNQESTKTIIRMLITKSNTLWLIYYMHFAAAHDGFYYLKLSNLLVVKSTLKS